MMLKRLIHSLIYILKYGVLWGVGAALLGGGIGAWRAGQPGALEGMQWAAFGLAALAGLLLVSSVRPDAGGQIGVMFSGHGDLAPKEFPSSETLIFLLACGICWPIRDGVQHLWS